VPSAGYLKLAASRISSRMAFIRKADIEKMLTGNPYHKVLPTNRPKKASVPTTKKRKANAKNVESNTQESEVLDYISGEEVMRIYKVKKSWLYTSAKRNQVPVCRIAGMNYYSRKHMNQCFMVRGHICFGCQVLCKVKFYHKKHFLFGHEI